MTEQSAVDALRLALLDLKDEIVADVLAGGDLDPARAGRIRRRMTELLSDPALTARMEEDLSAAKLWSYERGVETIDRLLAGEGIADVLALPEENTDIARAAITGTSLVVTIAPSLLERLHKSIALAFTGQATPGDVAARIVADFGTAEWRAETIVRTELGRMANEGTEARAQKALPGIRAAGMDMERVWIHSSGMATPAGKAVKGAKTRAGFTKARMRQGYEPRAHHKAMHGARAAAGDLFTLANPKTGESWRITGPHDPTLPAKEVVNCMCSVSFQIKRESATVR